MEPLKRRLLAGAVPGLALFAVFLAASFRPRPLASNDLRFATDVVGWLQAKNVAVRSVARWTHAPWPDTSHAATMRTTIGIVQVVVLNTQEDAKRVQIISAPDDGSGHLRFRYRLRGWPHMEGDIAWESGYPWFFFVYKNWILATPDAATAQMMNRLISKA